MSLNVALFLETYDGSRFAALSPTRCKTSRMKAVLALVALVGAVETRHFAVASARSYLLPCSSYSVFVSPQSASDLKGSGPHTHLRLLNHATKNGQTEDPEASFRIKVRLSFFKILTVNKVFF